MIIIGITGTLGAGKGTIVEYLKERKFKHFSVSGYIAEEVKRRGLEVNLNTLVEVGNQLRAEHSPSYLAEQLYEQASKSGQNCIIESIRTAGEIQALRKKERFFLFAVDADRKLRYRRICSRQSEKDQISYEDFVANEEKQLKSDDPNKQNLCECIARADFRFINNGTVDDLRDQVEVALSEIAKEILLREHDDR